MKHLESLQKAQALFRTQAIGAHLGLLEGRSPNLRKGANQYKPNKKRI